MVEYRGSDNNVVDMEEALTRARFSVVWVDAVAECIRLEVDKRWSVKRTVDGIQAGSGTVARSNFAFYRNGYPNSYNTFDEAARRIIEPV